MAIKRTIAKECSVADLQIILQLTQQRISQLEKQQILKRLANGKFDTYEATRAFYEYKLSTKDTIDYKTEQALHEKAKRQLAELELQKRRNEVHEAENVRIVMSDMLSNLRSQLLGIPAKMAPRLADRSADYIAGELTQEIEDRLTELCDYSPNLFSDEALEGDSDGQENG